MTAISSAKSSSKIFFPGLDGLRFIAAAFVILFHVEYKRSWFGISNFLHINFFYTIGYYGVTLFFVLSGFLITYLILKEVEKEGKVNVIHFYIRRALRIWPLYFFIILTGFFLWPNISGMAIPGFEELWDKLDWKIFLLYAFFLSPLVLVWVGNIPYLDQTWSVSVEEQFYLLWPILIRFYYKKIVRVLFLVIFIMLAIKTGILLINHFTGRGSKFLILAELSRFGCMATGGLAAYAFFKNKESLLRFVYRTDVLIITLAFTASLLIWGFSTVLVAPFLILIGLLVFNYTRKNQLAHGIWFLIGSLLMLALLIVSLAGLADFQLFETYKHEIIAFPFALIILNISANPEKFGILQHPVMQYLGRISYGVYMYHNIMITVSVKVLLAFYPAPESHVGHVLHYIIAFALAISCSALSYALLEKPFLKMKKRFTKIRSGANG
ncbi:MAG TPA: acyltransferase [Flavobacteriales bacterium]|nr:acyltransferase [Flavobacteriales bacterium]